MITLIDLPDCMIEQIFEYLTYDEIARKRLICRRIDKICQHLLNIGFSKMIKRHNRDLKRLKSLLPRRESERRNHPLARHADILTCIETRISMLSMTYTKYMEINLCCFIPGKIIDEVFRVLRLIETTEKPLRAHEVLQELRDISSMAIEHFDDKIAHLLRKKEYRGIFAGIDCPSLEDSITTISSQATTSNIINLTNHHPLQHQTSIKCLEARSNRQIIQKLELKYSTAMKKFNRMVQVQNKQSRQLRENAVLISEMNSQIVELKRRVEEADAKNREISANIIQITGEPNPGGGGVGGGGLVSVGGAGVIVSGNTGANIISTSTIINTNCPSERVTLCSSNNMKPRAATIILNKRRITESSSSVEFNNDVSSIDVLSKKPKFDL